jgi:hypothetical protein
MWTGLIRLRAPETVWMFWRTEESRRVGKKREKERKENLCFPYTILNLTLSLPYLTHYATLGNTRKHTNKICEQNA